ncbi:hypothetical protein MLD38_030934 [Melastoma candidum]|uniref:Uncharacterized protein n=1 Tax=Melastoma candidum TaxID=119954 RepID=A0ACB9MQ40_9MYRT|nr:hypothetical protein MLD38_030934 [Melastoma candidum]
MAQFLPRGAVRLLLDREGRGGSTDHFLRKLGLPPLVERRRLGSSGNSISSHSWSYSLYDVRARSRQRMNDEDLLGSEDEDDSGGSDDDLSCFRGLVLDLAYRPVNVVCWRRAICLEFMEKADVLEYYDQTVNSPSGSFYIPAVLRVPQLLQVVKRRRVKNSLSRKNILYRDNYTCQYCSSGENLTIDHILPISRGGEWTWENLVTACSRCNSRKGQKTIEEAHMKLLKVPKAPKDYDIVAIPLTGAAIRSLRRRKGTPEEWLQYLGRSSLEP